MADFYRILASYEALIYFVLAIGALFVFRWVWNSWNDWKQSAYQLEREFSARRLGQAAALLLIIVALFCAEFLLASFIIPGLPSEVFIATPTLNVLPTIFPSPAGEAQTQTAGLPSASQPASSGCIAGQIDITSPAGGAEVSGVIELVGTVDIPNFGFYKYEVATAGSETWATISAGTTVVRNGALGRWDTTALTPGDYQLRLVATDNQGQLLPACVIPVRVRAQT